MIFPDITFEEWIEKYPSLLDLDEDELEMSECINCSQKVIPKTPFIKKNYIGLISFECPFCREEFKTEFLIPNNSQTSESWNSLV